MELKEGMYVRNELYGIGRVKSICTCEQCKERGFYEPYIEFAKDYDYVTTYNYMQTYEGKASYNPIDLIEVGDYVNGLQVVEVRKHLHNDKEIVLTNGEFNWSFSKNESDYKIKSIVTKEMFANAEYKVETN